MPSLPFREIKRFIADGAAPGCAVSLFADGATQSCAGGHYTGSRTSPVITPQTTYDVASLTKLFTAALIVQLAEQGKLSLGDRCSPYLDNFRGSEVRLIDLLTHHVHFGQTTYDYRARYHQPADLYDALAHLTPPVRADTAVLYGNLAFFCLGRVVEHVTGESLQTAMHSLCRRLGLRHTYTGLDIAEAHIATPPTEVVDGIVIQEATHDETARMLGGLTGHAGIFSSAEDLAGFGRAWLDGRIIKTDERKRMIFHNYDPSGQSPQAAGWWLRYPAPDGQGTVATPGIYSHTGFTGSFLGINPSNGRVAALTCNRTYYGRDNRKHRAIWPLLITWLSG